MKSATGKHSLPRWISSRDAEQVCAWFGRIGYADAGTSDTVLEVSLAATRYALMVTWETLDDHMVHFRDCQSSHPTDLRVCDGRGICMSNLRVLDQRVSGIQSETPRHPRVELVTVKSLLSDDPERLQRVEADASLAEALKLLAEYDLRAVMVTNGGRLIGVLSERDYVRCSVAATLAPTEIAVREAMTPCDDSANLTDPLHDCLRLMLDRGLRYLPVLQGGSPIGLLSLEDLLRATVAYLERVFHEDELDQRIVNLRGTYSC